MSITVGTDTYVTVAEADSYIAAHFATGNVQLVAWTALSTADKEVHLRNAAIHINNVRYPGKKFNGDLQDMAFPRVPTASYPYRRNVTYVDDEQYGNVGDYDEVPQAVKDAQVEEAIELASPTSATANAEALQDNVTAYSIGHLSETYKQIDTSSLRAIVYSVKAQGLLQRYTGGGFSVR